MVIGVNFSVLFCEFPLDHFDETAAAVTAVYQITNYDARMKIRRGWGFLERDATEETAGKIVTALGEQRIGALAVPNEELRTLGEPKVMTGFQMDSEGLVPKLKSTVEETHPIS